MCGCECVSMSLGVWQLKKLVDYVVIMSGINQKHDLLRKSHIQLSFAISITLCSRFFFFLHMIIFTLLVWFYNTKVAR